MPGTPGQIGAPLLYEGAFDASSRSILNANNDWIVASTGTGVPGAGTAITSTGFGTAITLLAAGHPPGVYTVSIYAVVTTTITVATSWSFVLGFTDDKQAQTPTLITSSTLTAGTANQGQYLLRSTGATALTYTPTSTSISAGAVQYSIVVQRTA